MGAYLRCQSRRPLPCLRRAVLGAHVCRREHAAGELLCRPDLLAFAVLTDPAGYCRQLRRWLVTARFGSWLTTLIEHAWVAVNGKRSGCVTSLSPAYWHSNAPQGLGSRHLLASSTTRWSPSAAAVATIWHMQPTMAAVEELSAPPDSGSRYPAAPASQCHLFYQALVVPGAVWQHVSIAWRSSAALEAWYGETQNARPSSVGFSCAARDTSHAKRLTTQHVPQLSPHRCGGGSPTASRRGRGRSPPRDRGKQSVVASWAALLCRAASRCRSPLAR